MKKKYIAPVITVEHYELTQTIAACDNMKIGFADQNCVYNDADSTSELKTVAQLYFAGVGDSPCSRVPTIGNDIYGTDGICYHTNANAAFTS